MEIGIDTNLKKRSRFGKKRTISERFLEEFDEYIDKFSQNPVSTKDVTIYKRFLQGQSKINELNPAFLAGAVYFYHLYLTNDDNVAIEDIFTKDIATNIINILNLPEPNIEISDELLLYRRQTQLFRYIRYFDFAYRSRNADD